MLTVMAVLLIIAAAFLVVHVVHAPFPVWPTVLVLILIQLIQALPLGK